MRIRAEKPTSPEQSWEEQLAFAEEATRALGGRDLRKERPPS